MPSVVQEFKEFISRGNVVDLAVAVVIGAAFTGIVNAIVAGLLTPLIGILFSSDFRGIDFTVRDSTFEVGVVINAALQFLVVAAAVFFFFVKPINVLNERRRRGQEPAPPSPPTDEAVLLAEIRDLLRARAGGGPAPGGAGGPAGTGGPRRDEPPAIGGV